MCRVSLNYQTLYPSLFLIFFHINYAFSKRTYIFFFPRCRFPAIASAPYIGVVTELCPKRICAQILVLVHMQGGVM